MIDNAFQHKSFGRKRNQQFEYLKTSGQLIQDKTIGNKFVWLPRTIAEYIELANTV